jgi:hypothetical protein
MSEDILYCTAVQDCELGLTLEYVCPLMFRLVPACSLIAFYALVAQWLSLALLRSPRAPSLSGLARLPPCAYNAGDHRFKGYAGESEMHDGKRSRGL